MFKDYGRRPAAVKVFFERVQNSVANQCRFTLNPPYVETLDGLQPELQHEPENALLGVGFHETIARTARTHFLVLEVGDGQAEEVASVLETAGYRDVAITRDLAGIERVVEGSR